LIHNQMEYIVDIGIYHWIHTWIV